ncbi:signal recognition particle-docking protein FtsY [Neisseriaceae bacterium B1]
MLSFLKNIFKKDEPRPEQVPSSEAPVTQPETSVTEPVVAPQDTPVPEVEAKVTDKATVETLPEVVATQVQQDELPEQSEVQTEADEEATEVADIQNNEQHETAESFRQPESVVTELQEVEPAQAVEPEHTVIQPEERAPESEASVPSQNENASEVTQVAAPNEPEAQAEGVNSWANPTAPSIKPTVSHGHGVEESVGEKVSHWTHDMAHAVHDKADELEMRAEIVAEESSQAVKSWAHAAETWAEGMAHAVHDKVDELEMRAEIIATETAQAIEESIDTIEHAVIADAPPHPEMLSEEAEPEVQAPPPADAATDIDEKHLAQYHTEHPRNNTFQAASKTPVVAAESVTVFAGDEEVAESWTARLARGLSKSRNQMAKSLAGVFGGGKIDEYLYEDLETVLITSDMGIEATEHLMKEVRNRVSLKGLKDGNELRQALKDAIYDLIKPLEQPLEIPNNGQPFVIMMAGINGAGKTTSIGKLAKYFQSQGKTVMLAAGDTFRAAAREQLQEWGARNGVTVVSQESGDSAAVCFDAVESAKAKGIDIVLADTAGRLPTQLHLMEEIKKVKRVLQKSMPDAPHEVIVVLDANIGQNAVNQVVAFDDALGVTGLIVTKLDGTAKGGVLAALASSRPIPVRYIGVGESIDDLRPFNARAFVEALFEGQH